MQATIKKTSPYIRKETSTKRMMADVLIALMPLVAYGIYQYRFEFFIKILLASILAVAAEAFAFALMRSEGQTVEERFKKEYTINNVLPPIITAIIFMMTLPSSIPYVVVIIGVLFAILIGKMIFGGLGKNIFNPAGLARIFVGLSFGAMFVYTNIDGVTGATALGGTFPEVLDTISLKELFFGLIGGSSGEINKIAILIGGAYLLIRRAADFRVVITPILTLVGLMLVAGLAQGFGSSLLLKYVLYHLLSGGFLFGVTFMATDPITSPYTRRGRLIYGLIIGSLVVVIRLFGNLPEGMVFALLTANIFVPVIDYKRWTKSYYTKNFFIGYVIAILVIALIVFAGMGGF